METRIRFRTGDLHSTRSGRIALGWLGELCLLATIACATIATLYFYQRDLVMASDSVASSPPDSVVAEQSPIYSMSISAEQGQVMVVRSGRAAQALNIQPGEMQPNTDIVEGVTCVEFSPDGRMLAMGRVDGTVWLRDRKGTDSQLAVPPHKHIVRLVFSRDGERIIIGDEAGHVTIWNTKSNQTEGRFRVGTRRIEALALSPDGQYLVATGHHEALTIRDAKTGKVVDRLCRTKGDTCSVCIFSQDGRQLICGFVSGELKSFDMQSHEVLWARSADRRQSVLGLALSPDGKSFACGALTPYVEIYDVQSGEVLNTFPAHRIGVRCLSYLPDANFLVSAGYDGKVRMWHEDDWCPLYSL